MSSQYLSKNYVEETKFGFWFLRSHTWQHHVLRVAINDLRSLFSEPLPVAPVLLDAGCGQGKSFKLLQQVFAPSRLIGLDADPHSLELSKAEAAHQGLEVELIGSDCATLDVADASVDRLISLFGRRPVTEIERVLVPGGYCIVAVPGEEDLIELREQVQQAGHRRSRWRAIMEEMEAAGLDCIARQIWQQQVDLEPDAILDALAMTYRAGRHSQQARLEAVTAMPVTLAADLLLFQQQP